MALSYFNRAALVLESEFITTLTIGLELGIGVWLLAGQCPRLARVASIALFLVFFFFTAAMVVTGNQSCGCFGLVHVNPLWMNAIDALALIFLFLWRPVAYLRPLPCVGLLVTGIGCSAWIGYTLTPSAVSVVNMSDRANERAVIVLDPEAWIGSELPIADFIQPSVPLRGAQYLLVLYRENCAQCRQLIGELMRERANMPVLLVGVPPRIGQPRPSPENWVWAGLDPSKNWFVETPTLLTISDGIVIACRQPATRSEPLPLTLLMPVGDFDSGEDW